MVARPWSSSRLSCGECLFLSCDRNAGNSFPTTMGKDPSSRAWRRKWASSRLEGGTSWIFSSCGRCSRLSTGTSGTSSGGLRKGQSPCELAGGLSGFLSRRSRCLRSFVDSVPVPEDFSPVLTWILGYFWSLPRGVSPRLEWGHARALSPRAVAAVSRFPLRGSKDVWLSLEAFSRGSPTRLSHKAVPRATVV